VWADHRRGQHRQQQPVSVSPPITVVPARLPSCNCSPRETAVPGTPSGKTGTPDAQTAGTPFSVTVKAVDANWNLVGTNDTWPSPLPMRNAGLPDNTALVGGTNGFA